MPAKTANKTKASSQNPAPIDHDIIIAGGGYVGLSAAVALKTQAPHLDIVIFDAAEQKALEHDTRASAIAAAARKMLEVLEVWPQIKADAQPINKMIITDSKLSDAVRPVFLTFGDEADMGKSEAPFAHMVPNKTLIAALRKRAKSLGITQIFATGIDGFERKGALIEVRPATGEQKTLRAKLLIAADGVLSKLRETAGIKTMHWPYDQMGIVTTVAHEDDHEGVAQEHFLPSGPFAVLPLKNRRSSLVWTEPTDNAKRLLQMDDFEFELELETRFGPKLGEISVDGPRKAFPLGLRLARDFVQDRFALIGDAAHGIHPIAGQGLNLGFKDVAALAETIIEADRLGLDIGSLSVLERYQSWRRFDTVQMGATSDMLNRLFSNDIAPLRMARDVGLGIVDRLPGLKRFFIDQAAGRSGDLPRLLRGEVI